MSIKKKYDFKFIFEKFKKENKLTDFGKLLGKGNLYEIRDIKYKNELMVGKIIKEKNYETIDVLNAYSELYGQNIIKTKMMMQETIENENYTLIIMEKALLKDLDKLTRYYFGYNLLGTIYFPFKEKIGDNLLRFYVRQIINALLTLYQNNYVHFNIKFILI